VQKENIEHILNRLKETEVDLQGSRTSRSNMEQLNETVSKAKNIEDGLRRALSEKESEIQMLMLSVD
jgi:hypothetical protein